MFDVLNKIRTKWNIWRWNSRDEYLEIKGDADRMIILDKNEIKVKWIEDHKDEDRIPDNFYHNGSIYFEGHAGAINLTLDDAGDIDIETTDKLHNFKEANAMDRLMNILDYSLKPLIFIMGLIGALGFAIGYGFF